jgi:hypothetical protein
VLTDRWFWAGIGLTAFGVMLLFYALIAWACLRAAALSDPTHPYQGNPAPYRPQRRKPDGHARIHAGRPPAD